MPRAPEESARSLPARSTKLILLTWGQKKGQGGRGSGGQKQADLGAAQQGAGTGGAGGRKPTFSESSPVSWSWQRCVKTMVKTACERLLVSFMLVAATVLGGDGGVTACSRSPAQRWPLPLRQPASPGLVSTVHEVGNVRIGGHGQLRQVLHIGAQDGVLPDPQRAPTLGVQEVSYPLTVDLHVAHLSSRDAEEAREERR